MSKNPRNEPKEWASRGSFLEGMRARNELSKFPMGSMPITTRSSKLRTYTIREKRDAFQLASDIGALPAAAFLGYPPRTDKTG
ncbi:hypothetical protein JG688_00017459 [Phytophthora aleatoria]|uniref:Uncharacterized protein n=1 Tax=Phytophthora aleatoria TaxID=2496075 RepID=A0A8J5I6B5_9STRA|nr:hypothetical protein JG688_00017459 [Phytophthora aleatoria]